MEMCPKCGKYAVAYDGYRQITRCLNDMCDYRVEAKDAETLLLELEGKVKALEESMKRADAVIEQQCQAVGLSEMWKHEH